MLNNYGNNTVTTFHQRRPIRVGIYARFSTEMQRDSSIEDQIRQCTEAANEQQWIVDPHYIRSDMGLSGATLQTRPGILSLITDIEKNPNCIDGLVVDDTSRLGRNLADVLDIWKLLEFHGKFLFFVNQQLCSQGNKDFYYSIIRHGAQDEEFLKKLAYAVLRGQKGRILDHMIHGGKYFGYIAEAVPDPTKRGTASRPAIRGVKLLIDPDAASIIRQIYDWAVEGYSFLKIARMCEAHQYPRLHANIPWNISRILGILHNEMYLGRLIWGRTSRAKHPKTGQIINRVKERSAWVIVDAPELAIISQDLWDKVQATIESHRRVKSKLGGVGRQKDHAELLLSGKLVCGKCGGPVVVIGTAPNGDRRYQCKNRRYYGTCDNCTVVHSSVIEHAFVSHIVERINVPERIEEVINRLSAELNSRHARTKEAHDKDRSSFSLLKNDKTRLEREIQNLLDALKAIGPSQTLLTELARVEAHAKALNERISRVQAPSSNVSTTEVRAFVTSQLGDFVSALLVNKVAARQAVLTHVSSLRLVPDEKDGLPIVRVTGELLLGREKL